MPVFRLDQRLLRRADQEGTLRRQRLLSKLDVYLAFGAYDCSMLRICAERGALSFQQNWLKQMPICASCKFDLIFQVEGALAPDRTGPDRRGPTRWRVGAFRCGRTMMDVALPFR